MTKSLHVNVRGPIADDVPFFQADSGWSSNGRFEGSNRWIIDLALDVTGGCTVWYQQRQKSFRVIAPPGEGQWEATDPKCFPPEYGSDYERVAMIYEALAPPLERLSARGRFFYAGERVLHWRSLTAFKLLHLLATGEAGRVDDFLGFCAARKLSPRVLCMADVLFYLDPAVAFLVLPDLLERARRSGTYVELVALADTKFFPTLDYGLMVEAVGRCAEGSGVAAVEVANEVLPIHETQSDKLTPDYLKDLAQRVPASVPVSVGSTHGDACEDRTLATLGRQLPNGYATAHDLRTIAENGWKWTRHPNDLGWIADDIGIYLINDEPQRADLTPGKHLGTAAVCRVIRDIGDTFHYQGGLHATLPNPDETRALDGRLRGWSICPDDWHGHYRNAGQGWPVKGFRNGLRAYSSVRGDEAYTVCLDADAMTVDWYPDAKPELRASEDGTKVYRVTK